MTHRIKVGESGWPRLSASTAVTQWWNFPAEHELGANLAPSACLFDQWDEVSRQRRRLQGFQIDMNPQRCRLYMPARRSTNLGAPFGPMRAISTAPGREGHVLHVDGKVVDPHLSSAHHPAMNVAVLSVHRVIVCNVLEVTSSRIESQPSLRGDITQSNPTIHAEATPHLGQLNGLAGLPHAVKPYPNKGTIGFVDNSLAIRNQWWFPEDLMLSLHRSLVCGVAGAGARTDAPAMWRDAMATFVTYYQGFTKRPRQGLLGLTT